MTSAPPRQLGMQIVAYLWRNHFTHDPLGAEEQSSDHSSSLTMKS